MIGPLSCWAEDPAPAGKADWAFTDVEGRRHEPFADESVKAIVVIFVATDCPIANYFQPTISRLASRFREKGGEKGVRFLLFYPDPDTTAADVRTHKGDFKIEPPVFRDPEFALAKRLKATTVPEAFVIARNGSTKYRGRIDNTYEDWGKRRPAPTSHDLRDALEAVLAGKEIPPAQAVTEAVGCYIPFELGDAEPRETPRKP